MFLIVGALVGYLFYSGKVNADNVKTPGSGEEAATGVEGFFNWFADMLSSIGDAGWRILTLLLLVGLCMWVFKKVPMVVWLILTAFGLLVAVMV